MMLAVFGGYLTYMIFDAQGIALDWITFSLAVWNFAVVGILALFWYAPAIINQFYLIMISALMAIYFTRLPEWTTWAILAAIAIYDIFAVLCPRGPLRVLVETAQQRQETIPALLYNGSIVPLMGMDAIPGEEEAARDEEKKKKDEDRIDYPDMPLANKGVKLGLGDFVFYSVLVGRAALFDMITVFTCFIGIITGLFATILLLAIFKKALPALPISIALGILFFFITRFVLLPFILVLGASVVFV